MEHYWECDQSEHNVKIIFQEQTKPPVADFSKCAKKQIVPVNPSSLFRDSRGRLKVDKHILQAVTCKFFKNVLSAHYSLFRACGKYLRKIL